MTGYKNQQDHYVSSCPSCGCEATPTGERCIDQQVYRCWSCGIEFLEGESGTDWMPAEFTAGDTYFAIVNICGKDKRMELRVEKKEGSFIHASVNEQMRGVFELYIVEKTEIMRISEKLIGEAFNVFPYNLILKEGVENG